MIFGQLFK